MLKSTLSNGTRVYGIYIYNAYTHHMYSTMSHKKFGTIIAALWLQNDYRINHRTKEISIENPNKT